MKRINSILFSLLCVIAAGISTVVVFALTNVNMRLFNNVVFDAEGVYFKAHLTVYYIEDISQPLYEDVIDLSGRPTHNPYRTSIEIPEDKLKFSKEHQIIVYKIEIENFTEDTMVRASLTNFHPNTYVTNTLTLNNIDIDPWTVSMGDDAYKGTLEMRTTIKSLRHSFALDNSFTVLIEPVQ
ncbi:MAG: hypothetical protein J6A98_02570 [Clostridia bacterium]|nr:hypothetical protein [Clostridia bacterium]